MKLRHLFSEFSLWLKKPTVISIEELFSENRKDLNFRVAFLDDVINKKKSPKDTKYYRFIENKTRAKNTKSPEEFSGEYMVNKFISLFEDIKENGLKKPIIVDIPNGSRVLTHSFKEGKKTFKYMNVTVPYQVMRGAHRVAIMKFLGEEIIPAKVLQASRKSYPDYSHI